MPAESNDLTNLEERRLFQHTLPIRQEGGNGATESTLGKLLTVAEAISLLSFAAASHNHAASDINSGTLAHERGGLEADVSAYNALVKISGGSTSQAAAGTDHLTPGGISGGQTLNGDTDSGGDMELRSTAHATKGKIIFGAAGNSAYDEANERFGVGTNAPGLTFHAAAGTNFQFRLENTGNGETCDIGCIDYDGRIFFSSSAANIAVPAMTLDGAIRTDLDGGRTVAASATDVNDFGIRMTPLFASAAAYTFTRYNYLYCDDPDGDQGADTVTITDACVIRFDAAAGTHKAVDSGSTKTSPGTVSAWVKININGTIHYMPAYTSKTS